MTRQRGCVHRPSVEVRRDELLVHERWLVGVLQPFVVLTGFVDQLFQEGLAPALVAIPQLHDRLGGPACQTRLLRRITIGDNEGPLDLRGGLDTVVTVQGSEVVIREPLSEQRCGRGQQSWWQGCSLLCRELLVGVGALGMLILHCLAQVRVG